VAEQSRLGVDDALALIREHCAPVSSEVIVAEETLGRVLADPVIAQRNVPAFRASAMDGYALWNADLGSAPIICGDVAAGDWPDALPVGHAVAISTGAPVPERADRIVPRERARIDHGRLRVDPAPECGPNIRQIGEDMKAGVPLASGGTVITADIIGAMIAGGVERVAVRRRPAVGLLSTGSEFTGGDAGARVIDSNGPMIAACAAGLDLDVRQLGAVADDVARIDAALDGAERCDVVVSTGGVSIGDHDCVRRAIERRGARILFHGLAMRPGKPILSAVLPDGRLFFGLPGNPVAALVGFRFFVTAAFRSLLGLDPEQGIAVQADVEGREATTLFLRARVTHSSAGIATVDTMLDQRSHILSSVNAADGWLRVDRHHGLVSCFLFEKTARLA